MVKPAIPPYRWRFFRAGGFDQVQLQTGADLLHLEELDQKLWVALACPTTGLEFDPKTLALIDTDNDGRIRAPELIAAVHWACSVLRSADDLVAGADALPLSAINDANPEGRQLLASARQILVNLGKSDSPSITLNDTEDTAKIFALTQFNGDGIVPAAAAADDATRAVIEDIILCLGSDLDRSGKPGISQARTDQFFAEAQACSDWWRTAEGNPRVRPLGDQTAAAGAALQAVRSKAADYFTRCRLAAFDPRAVDALNREEKEYLVFTAKDLTLSSAEIAAFPLAHIEPGKPLPLDGGINPAWAEAIGVFRAAAVKPLLGDKAALTESDWGVLQARLAPYDEWIAARPATRVEQLGVNRIREILDGPARQAIAALIAEDKKLEPEVLGIAAVEKLVRYYRDLFRLCNNFVSFRDFYGRRNKAVFQAGTLYLDQRSCDLCLSVEDPAKHAVMASMAGTYLAYCECVRKGSGEKMQIVAAVTGGDSDNLMVGRNGLFYDRKGRDWDATISKLVDNPISIRQAFWAPYKKAARMIHEQIAKRAAAADSAAVGKLARAAAKTGEAAVAAPTQDAPAAEPPRPKLDPGLIAALSVGAAGVGGMIGGILSSFLGLKAWMPLGVLAIILIISGPSMILAWLKLRRRNLGPILDANGWAVNAKAKINVPFGASLTRVAALPPGAQRDLADPFAEKKSPWPAVLIAVILLAILGWALHRRNAANHTIGAGNTAAATNAVPASAPPAGQTNPAAKP